MSYLRLRASRQQRKALAPRPKKAVSGNVNKSLRRHTKLNHAAVGGVGHMGRRSSAPKGPCPREPHREPMKATLADFIGMKEPARE